MLTCAVGLALRYMYGPGSGGLFKPKWDFMSLTLVGLGICSFLFHASLRQSLEFADELSMLGLTWSMIHSTYTTGQTQSRSRLIAAALTAFHLPFAAFYIWSPRIVYQVTAFSAALILVGLRTQYLVHGPNAVFPKGVARDWTVRSLKATAISMTGYLLWNIENMYCAELRVLKAQVGLPWAWLLEFHGWWHVLTAIGASKYMDVAREIKAEVGRRKQE